MNIRNKGMFNKKVASMIVFTTVVANIFSPISVQALGRFDFSSSLVSREINKEEFVLVPGVKEKRYSFNDIQGKRLEVVVAEVDTKNPYIGIEAGTPGDKDAYGMESLTSQAKVATTSEEKVVAGVNGDFYYMVTGEPIGVVHKDGRGIKTTHAPGWDFFGILKDGTPIIGDAETYKRVKDNLEEALGGSALLIKDGKVNEGLSAEREPRTAVGIKGDGSVFFITVDGRQEPYSAGISLLNLGRLMKDMGAVQALNLDGGGSTTYVSKKPVSNTLSLGNRPSGGGERRVGNSWLVVTKFESDGEFATAHIDPFDKSFTPQSTVQFKAYGRDMAGEEASLPDSLTWSLSDDSFGEIDGNGLFISTGKVGQVEVLLSYNDEIVGRTWIEVAVPDKLKPNNKQISTEKNSQIPLSVSGEYEGRELKLKNEDIVWEVPEEIGTIDSYGVLHTKDKTAVGKITAKFKGTSISTTIDVAVGKPSQFLWDFEKDINWKMDTTGKGEVASLEKGVYGKDPVKSGNGSLKINFDFTKGEKNTTLGVYAGPGENVEVSGSPKEIGMWIYGTPESQGYWMRTALVDAKGQTHNLNLTSESGVNWTGWKYVKAKVPTNVATPFKISGNQGIRVMSISSGNIGPMTKGNLYIDDIKAIYSEEEEEVIVSTTRMAGADRFGTATAIAKKMYTEKASTVVITNGYNFTDQISASTLASNLKAPLLLIGNNAKNDKETMDYLKEHMNKSGKVYVVGGKSAVKDSVVNSIKALGITNIERFEGKDRYDTNIKTNAKLNIPEGTPVIIASGEGFADALSIASIAQMNKYPIILTSKNALSKDAEAYIKKIKPSKAYIVGGEGVVSLNVKNALSKLTQLKDSDIIRLSGSDRYTTNMSVLKHFNIEGDAIAIASGVSFPDSLVGSVYATHNNAPIMLVNNSMNLTEQRKYIDMKAYKNIIIFGGSGVVGENLF